jgi:hypothetical protein
MCTYTHERLAIQSDGKLKKHLTGYKRSLLTKSSSENHKHKSSFTWALYVWTSGKFRFDQFD